jgi:hypothetical protein
MIKLFLSNVLHTTGVNTLLLTDRKNWANEDLAKNYLYFGGLYLPTNILWSKMNKFIRKIGFPEFNEHQRNFFEIMYFASKKALIYDLIMNHILY